MGWRWRRVPGVGTLFNEWSEGWQVLRILDIAKVVQQGYIRVPRAFVHVGKQAKPNATVQVRVSQDFVDEALELKPQKAAPVSGLTCGDRLLSGHEFGFPGWLDPAL